VQKPNTTDSYSIVFGYVTQAWQPMENILAMVDAVKEHG
jgi:hypothetical protein